MSTLRSLVFAGIGAAAISSGSCEYGDRYKGKQIFNRLKPAIERTYIRERSTKNPAERTAAAARRKERYSELRKNLDRLESKGSKERCRFEVDFSKKLLSPGAASFNEDYKPYSHCSSGEQMKRSSVAIPLFGGALALLYGLVGLVRSLSRKEDS